MEVHIVQKGDTLWKISRQYNISFDELKRVNAHLGNPDYIIPGMKIFLPKEGKEPSAEKQGQVKKEMPSKQVESKGVESVGKPSKEVEKKVESERRSPIPLPKAPKITSKPIEEKKDERKPVPEQAPPLPKPEKEAENQAPPLQQPQYQPQTQQPIYTVQPYPIYGIPCGWLPVYDADCLAYPYMKQPALQHVAPQQQKEELPHFYPQQSTMEPSFSQSKAPSKDKGKTEEKLKDSEKSAPFLGEQPLFTPKTIPDINAIQEEEKKPHGGPVQPKREKEKEPHFQEQMNPYTYPIHAGENEQFGWGQAQAQPQQPYQYSPQTMPMQPHPYCNQCNRPIQQPIYHMPPYYYYGY